MNDEGGVKNLRNNEELLMKIVSMSTDVRNMSLAFNQNPFSQQTQTAGPSPETQPTNPIQTQTAGQQASSDGSLQAQVNMISTQMQSTNAIALEAKKKSDYITSQIDQIKKELEKN